MKTDYFEYKNNFKKYENIKSNLVIEGKVKKPKITIAIPTYRRVDLLKEALLSAINQKGYLDYNVIVIDNDDSENRDVEKMILTLNSEKVSYYKNEKNIGMFGNWNRCIELADGEYLSILNDDDWLEKNFLFEINKYIDGNKVIYSQYKIQDRREIYGKKFKVSILRKIYYQIKQMKQIRKLNIMDFFYFNRSAGTLGILFHRNTIYDLGGYNDEYYPSSDYFFHAKCCYYLGAKIVKKELGNYRIQQNESMNPKTVSLWPYQAELFRNYLIETLQLKEYFRELNKTITEYQKKNINVFWKTKIIYDYKKIKKKHMYYFKIRERMRSIFG